MLTPAPPGEQLMRQSAVSLCAALLVGACIWIPWLMYFEPGERASLLCIVISNQLGFLLAGARWKRRSVALVGLWRSVLLGVGVAVAAVVFGVGYDVILRWLFGPAAPTIGPWGVVRDIQPVAVAFVFGFGVILGPIGDESLFRVNLYGRFADAGRPGVGVLLSGVLFALSRLDWWNFPAYAILGGLLCWTYHRSGSLLAPVVAHGLLNAIMFLFLFSGYQ